MSLFNIFNIAGSGMSAQSVRLNATASNLANAESASGTPESAYRARNPVFKAVMDEMNGNGTAAVKVLGIVEDQAPAIPRYQPENPLADENGYVYLPNVSVVDEMANMMAASRAYQNNVEIMKTSKQMLLNTLRLGQ